MKRTERQAHGFIFQNWIINKFLDMTYTAKWDIPSKINPLTRKSVSIKTAKFGSGIGLGDALNQFKINEDFELVIAFYKEINNKKRVVNMQKLDIPKEKWRELWGNLKEKDLIKFDRFIRSKSGRNLKGEQLNEFRKAVQQMKKDITQNYTGKISLNPKIDSKTQRRLQCTLSFKVLHDEFGVDKKIQKRYQLWKEHIELNSIPLQ